MKFVMSATATASDLRQVLRHWEESGDCRNPFAYVLISPLFTAPSTFQFVRDELKGKRQSTVYFDSGGYFVQQGRLPYDALYGRLLNCYRANPWADWYVLPDHVPTSRDSREIVESKVYDTITAAQLFHTDMPSQLKGNFLPVVQGHTEEQVRACIKAYIELGAKYIGFGSFGTSGASSQMNTVTDQSVRMLKLLKTLSQEYRFKTHLFGVSTPPILYLFDRLSIYSFDSLAWMKAAGYGNVFLPLVRGYMVTYRIYDRTHIYQEHFEHLKELTGHRCAFCDDFSMLVNNRMFRILHNLSCVLDTLDILATGQNGSGASTRHFSYQEILKIVKEASPSYLRYYQSTYEGV